MPLANGTILQNRYRVAGMLGQGGMGVVYLAHDLRLGERPVAVKQLNISRIAPADVTDALESFRHEAYVLSQLNHPRIANVIDAFSTNGLEYLVIEYVAGESLEAVCHRFAGQPLAEQQVLVWARQICQVLDYLHNHQPPVIFRDLKPSNIMVQPNGDLKIIDFGIVRYFKPGQTQDTRAMGTPGYAPPEQYGTGQTDARSDIYSLGVILHQLLTGYDPASTPFNIPDIHNLNPNVSPHVAAIVRQATNHDRKQRPENARVIATALGVPLDTPITPTTLPLPPEPKQPGSLVPYWAMAAVAVLVVLVVMAGIGLFWLPGLLGEPPTPVAVIDSDTITPVSPVIIEEQAEATATPTVIEESVPAIGDATTTVTLVPTTPTATPLPPDTPTATAVPTPNFSQWPIVFDSTRDGANNIYIMDGDGQNVRRLTSDATQFDAEAVLSPDGQWIAYESRPTQGGNYTIYLMRTDGSNRRALANGRLANWSPDGRFIAYETLTQPEQIAIIDVGNGQDRQLTNGGRHRAPSWSPDGNQLAIMAEISGGWQILLINVISQNQTQITTGRPDKRFPAWSPDGQWIAYNTIATSGGVGDVWLVDPTGQDVRQVTSSAPSGRPAWSPDSQYLIYNRLDGSRWLLYRIRWDGEDETQITGVGDDQRANWGR